MEAAMHAVAFTLVVSGAVVHALWNIIAKASSGGTFLIDIDTAPHSGGQVSKNSVQPTT
jgi:hypothetical protein